MNVEGFTGMQVAAVRPEEDIPRSSWSISCHEKGCVETLALSRTTPEMPSEEDEYMNMLPAMGLAAVSMGWRVHQCVWWCPTHVASKLLACADCVSPCPECSCPGGPGADAIDGMLEP
jgi:hypothetical protein